ncbi:MAG: hypothetical protein ACK42C_00070 [Aquificaceae bacterium]
MKTKTALEFVLGLVVGILCAHLFLYLIFSEDEVQKQVAQKAQCIYERLSEPQSPQEKLEFVQKHEKIIAKCEEVWHEND